MQYINNLWRNYGLLANDCQSRAKKKRLKAVDYIQLNNINKRLELKLF